MNRPQMGIIAWIGVIIVIGLLITYPKGTSTVANSAFSGFGNIIKDLQRPTGPASH